MMMKSIKKHFSMGMFALLTLTLLSFAGTEDKMLFGTKATYTFTDNSNFSGIWEVNDKTITEKNSKGVEVSKFEVLDESTDQFTIKVISSERELLKGFAGQTATVLKSFKNGEIQLAAETRNGVIKATLK